MSMNNYKLGCIPSKYNYKDFITTAIIPKDNIIPNKFYWEPPIIRDQGNYGMCVGFGSAGDKNIQEYTEGDYQSDGFSPLFVYTICKSLDGCPDEEGTQISIAMKVLKNIGIVPEKDMPYSMAKTAFDYPKITKELKEKAKKYKIKSYAKLPNNNLIALKQALLISPVVSGLFVTESFYNVENGFLNTPNGNVLGGHCTLFIAYDDELIHTYKDGKTKKGFIKFQNSWSKNWGDNGCGWIAYEDLFYELKNYYNNPFVFEMWSNVDEISALKSINNKCWKVQILNIDSKDECFELVKSLKDKGFDTYIINDGDIFVILLGVFNIEVNAINLYEQLKEYGYDVSII